MSMKQNTAVMRRTMYEMIFMSMMASSLSQPMKIISISSKGASHYAREEDLISTNSYQTR